MHNRMRKSLLDFTPYTPGLSIEELREKYQLQNIIKLASNENPLGVSPLVLESIKKYSSSIFRYPQNASPALSDALAQFHNIEAERIICGNGSDELIDMLIRMTCEPEKNTVLCYSSCFSVYKMVAKLCGVHYKEVARNADFSQPLADILATVTDDTAIIFLTSPDNPTGLAIPSAELVDFLEKLPQQTLLVLDEAYIDFADAEYQSFEILKSHPNVAFLRTFSKAYGLAGLRLGYGIIPLELAKSMQSARLPFSVNLLAEHAGIAALTDTHFYKQTLKVTAENKLFLMQELQSLSCKTLPSQANFIMFAPTMSAEFVFQKLLERGVIVRLLKNFSFPDWIRVSIGTKEESNIFIKELKGILHD